MKSTPPYSGTSLINQATLQLSISVNVLIFIFSKKRNTIETRFLLKAFTRQAGLPPSIQSRYGPIEY